MGSKISGHIITVFHFSPFLYLLERPNLFIIVPVGGQQVLPREVRAILIDINMHFLK